MKDGKMNSGELAAKAGLNKETIRFYERRGLLPKPNRTAAGYRLFTKVDLDRLVFIKNAKNLGFSLSEIQELLAIADGKIVKCSDVRAIAEKKLNFINVQIDNLAKLKKVLTILVSQCSRSKKIADCPIIESIIKGEK